MKNPNDEEDDEYVDPEVRDYVEQLPGYQEHMKEIRGDDLTFGDS